MSIYRNWPLINEIDNIHLRMALSTIDLKSVEGLRLIKRLRDYFTDTPVVGPIRLSTILKLDIAHCIHDKGAVAGVLPYSHGVIPNEIPIIGYNYPLDGRDIPDELNFTEFLPKWIRFWKLAIGWELEVEGANLIVIENNYSTNELICIPADAIIVDCKVHEYC